MVVLSSSSDDDDEQALARQGRANTPHTSSDEEEEAAASPEPAGAVARPVPAPAAAPARALPPLAIRLDVAPPPAADAQHAPALHVDTHGGVLRQLAAMEEDATATLQSRKDVVDQPAAVDQPGAGRAGRPAGPPGRAGRLRVDIVKMPEDSDRPATIRLPHEESTMAIDSVRKAVDRQDGNVRIDARAFPHEHSIVPTSNRDSPAWAPVHLLFNEAKRVANTPLPPGADAVATSMAMAAKVDLTCRRVLWLLPRAFDSAADPGTTVFHACASNWGELALPGWWCQAAKAAAVASLRRVRDGLADICNRRVAYNRSALAAVTAVRETALAEVKANPDGFEDVPRPVPPRRPAGYPALGPLPRARRHQRLGHQPQPRVQPVGPLCRGPGRDAGRAGVHVRPRDRRGQSARPCGRKQRDDQRP